MRQQPGERDLRPRRTVLRGDSLQCPALMRGGTRRQGEPGEKCQPVSLAGVEDRLRLPVTDAEPVLNRDDVHDLECLVELVDVHFEMPTWRIFPSSCSSESAPTDS